MEGLEAVRLYGLDPVAHATDLLVYAQLKAFFREAVQGAQPWHNIVLTWEKKANPEDDTKNLEDEQV